MSVQHAGSIIRQARLNAGLTQEQLSDGVCSTLSLSRIENGSAGVSPATFQTLMAHAGIFCEAYPTFSTRADFDCFYALKKVRFYLDSWQLTPACQLLDHIEMRIGQTINFTIRNGFCFTASCNYVLVMQITLILMSWFALL